VSSPLTTLPTDEKLQIGRDVLSRDDTLCLVSTVSYLIDHGPFCQTSYQTKIFYDPADSVLVLDDLATEWFNPSKEAALATHRTRVESLVDAGYVPNCAR